MMENFYVYQTKRKRSNYVIQKSVLHKSKTFLFRADSELTKNIQDLSKELEQTDSKVIKDILEDFFLDQKLKRQKLELSGIC